MIPEYNSDSQWDSPSRHRPTCRCAKI